MRVFPQIHSSATMQCAIGNYQTMGVLNVKGILRHKFNSLLKQIYLNVKSTYIKVIIRFPWKDLYIMWMYNMYK